jgi:hypothetical protein
MTADLPAPRLVAEGTQARVELVHVVREGRLQRPASSCTRRFAGARVDGECQPPIIEGPSPVVEEVNARAGVRNSAMFHVFASRYICDV